MSRGELGVELDRAVGARDRLLNVAGLGINIGYREVKIGGVRVPFDGLPVVLQRTGGIHLHLVHPTETVQIVGVRGPIDLRPDRSDGERRRGTRWLVGLHWL